MAICRSKASSSLSFFMYLFLCKHISSLFFFYSISLIIYLGFFLDNFLRYVNGEVSEPKEGTSLQEEFCD